MKELVGNPSPRPRPSDTPLPGERGRGEGLKFYSFSFTPPKNQVGFHQPMWVSMISGTITYLSNEAPAEVIAIESVQGFALPGFQNAHSHAFQYAMAGLAENHAVGYTR
jgi:hypothetical protein